MFRIKNVNVGDLLQKKLSGFFAELIDPEIVLSNKSKEPVVAKSGVNRLSNFYKTLHELGDLINVDSFQLRHALLRFDMAASATQMFMHTLNATVF